jgi:hypothetical protein
VTKVPYDRSHIEAIVALVPEARSSLRNHNGSTKAAAKGNWTDFSEPKIQTQHGRTTKMSYLGTTTAKFQGCNH